MEVLEVATPTLSSSEVDTQPLEPISLDAMRIVASPEQVCSELDGEAVILDLKSGQYYGLNPVGARIWQLIQEPQSLSSIRQVLLAEYAVDQVTCDRDLQAIVADLQQAGLVQVCDGAAA